MAPISVNLWSRDLLQKWKLMITNETGCDAEHMMNRMVFEMGKDLKEITKPITSVPKNNKC